MFSSILGQFQGLPVPDADLSGKTVIVTGANVGLGLEASRHFARLGASRIILACRNLDKAEAAKKDLDESVAQFAKERGADAAGTEAQQPTDLVVWALDLSKFDSIKAFAARAAKELDRVDIFMSNASVWSASFVEADQGWEQQLAVNVIGTFLLAVLMLPKLRETGDKFGVTARICVTASMASYMALFSERKEKKVFQALNANRNVYDRYSTTKLLQIIAARHLAVAARASGKGDLVINSFHPGICNTELFRFVPWPLSLPFNLGLRIFGRTPEMGSRTLLAAALSDEEAEETNGRYMDNCVVVDFPPAMKGDEGEVLQVKVWEELLEILEDIEPGVTRNI